MKIYSQVKKNKNKQSTLSTLVKNNSDNNINIKASKNIVEDEVEIVLNFI